MLWSVVEIDEGEAITVKYRADRSYFGDGCKCKTCNGGKGPEAPRQAVVEEEGTGRKRTRRGGRRRQGKRAKKVESDNGGDLDLGVD